MARPPAQAYPLPPGVTEPPEPGQPSQPPRPLTPREYALPPGTTRPRPPVMTGPTVDDPAFGPAGPPAGQVAPVDPFANWGAGQYTIIAGGGPGGTAEAHTRTVQQNELAGHRQNELLREGGVGVRAARGRGQGAAARMGLMGSGLAEGYAQRAMIESVQPLALQEAGQYGMTASENMGARNRASEVNANNATQLASSQMSASAQLGSASIGADASIRRAQIEAELTRQGWDRQDASDEADRIWRAEQSELDFNRNAGLTRERDQYQREWNVEDRDMGYGYQDRWNWWSQQGNQQVMRAQQEIAIYNNTSLTPAQQEAAVRAMHARFDLMDERYNNYLNMPPPPVFGPGGGSLRGRGRGG